MLKAGRVTILILLIGLLLLSGGAAAKPELSLINFGFFTAPEDMDKTVVINFNVDLDALKSLEIVAQTNPTIKNQNQYIPLNRLQVQVEDSFYQLKQGNTIIDLDRISGAGLTRLPVVFTYTVKPYDLPGIYETVLNFREIGRDGQILDSYQLPLRIEVGSWIRIETQSPEIIMGPSRESFNIYTLLPGVIKVAGNVNWELTGFMALEDIFQGEELYLKAFQVEGQAFQVVNPQGVSISTRPQLLASGVPTILGEDYWVEVPFTMEIKDYTRIPAGRITFPLVFHALPARP